MFTFLHENLHHVSVKLSSVLQDTLSIAKHNFMNINAANINAANGSMLNHFEQARASFNQNGEFILTSALVLIVSFIIGVGVYFLTQSHTKNKN